MRNEKKEDDQGRACFWVLTLGIHLEFDIKHLTFQRREDSLPILKRY
jgi:hypothetical protein